MDVDDIDVNIEDNFYNTAYIDDILKYFIGIYGCECYRIFVPDILKKYNIKGDFILYSREHPMGGYHNTFIKLNIDVNKSEDMQREYIIDCLLKNEIIDIEYVRSDEFFMVFN